MSASWISKDVLARAFEQLHHHICHRLELDPSGRGAKAAAASFIGVKPQQYSDVLGGRRGSIKTLVSWAGNVGHDARVSSDGSVVLIPRESEPKDDRSLWSRKDTAIASVPLHRQPGKSSSPTSLHRSDRTSYRSFLREMMKTRGLTQRQLAEAMGRSESWVSQMMNQVRPLKIKDADMVTQILDLNEVDRLRFLALVDVEESDSSLSRDRAMAMLASMEQTEERDDLTEEYLYAISEWHVAGVMELARCEGYRPDPRWIAATLCPRISVEDAEKALKALIRLEWLGPDGYMGDRTTNLQTPPTIPRGRVGDAARRYHRTVLELSIAALDQYRHTERLTLNSCVAMSEEGLATFRRRVRELLHQIVMEGSYHEEQPNRVYLFAASLFPASLFTDTEYDPENL